jgi:hypothetical protein
MANGLADLRSWQPDFDTNLYTTLKLFVLCSLLLTISVLGFFVNSHSEVNCLVCDNSMSVIFHCLSAGPLSTVHVRLQRYES